jgi:hypothetical protein
LALRALGDVMRKRGKVRPEMYGRTVTLEEWLDQCFEIGAVGRDAAKPWRDLQNRQEGLIVKGRILVQGSLVKITGSVPTDTTSGNVIPMSVAAVGGIAER